MFEEARFDPGEEGLPDRYRKVSFDDPIQITETGYIYIWVSNESENTKVWFDDLKITHTQTLVTQATDYGVWGDVIWEQKTRRQMKRFIGTGIRDSLRRRMKRRGGIILRLENSTR